VESSDRGKPKESRQQCTAFRDTHKDQYPDAMEIYAEHVGIIDSFKGGDVKRAVALLKEKIC
jgi:hypothetical protein